MAAVEKPAKRARSEACGPPPVYASIQDLASGSKVNEERYNNIITVFETRYSCKPTYLTRAPGRVNLIGEHVDYSGYGVLPMAIEQDIVIASRPNDRGEFCFHNIDADTYADYSCPVAGFEIDKKHIIWYSYILCGIKGIMEELGIESPVGIDMIVDGSIPPASGLSSSSALVCCASLTTICMNGVDFPSKKDLAEICARSERFIGTQGGGMDQAISFLGEAGKAMMIEFDPVRSSEVQIPDGFGFVISNTLVSSNKAVEGYFNTRVAECHLAARVIAKKKDKKWKEVNRLIRLQNSLDLDLGEMSGIVTECLHPEPYTRNEICQILEITDQELTKECLTEKSKDVQKFKLHDRAKHVYEEANRVYLFNSTANSGSGVTTAKELGRLMDESHKSCSFVYECSCTELDGIVTLSKEAGALGSRLTGAGWGGCAVSLVKGDEITRFLHKLEEGYFKKHGKISNLSASLFATKPGPGAGVCKLEI